MVHHADQSLYFPLWEKLIFLTWNSSSCSYNINFSFWRKVICSFSSSTYDWEYCLEKEFNFMQLIGWIIFLFPFLQSIFKASFNFSSVLFWFSNDPICFTCSKTFSKTWAWFFLVFIRLLTFLMETFLNLSKQDVKFYFMELFYYFFLWIFLFSFVIYYIFQTFTSDIQLRLKWCR